MAHAEMIHKLIDAFNEHDSRSFAANYAENAVAHDPFYPEPLRGRAAIEKDVADFFRAFPDINGEVPTVLEKDDTSAEQWIISGTNSGPLAAPGEEIPATGRKITVGIGIFSRFNDKGKIVEQHRYYDVAGFLQQLGVSQ